MRLFVAFQESLRVFCAKRDSRLDLTRNCSLSPPLNLPKGQNKDTMKLLVYFILVNAVLAAVTQFCERFESPKEDQEIGFDFNITEKVTLLGFHEEDLKDTNIPPRITLDALRGSPESGGFGLCTSSLKKLGQCDEIGTFAVNYKDSDAKESVMNIVGEVGHEYFYPARKAGIVCYVVYQDDAGIAVRGFSAAVVHSDGFMTSGQFAKIETLLLGFLITAIIASYWSSKFGIFDNRIRLSTPHAFTRNLILISYPYLTFKTQAYGEDSYKFAPRLLSWALYILLYDALYNFSLNSGRLSLMDGSLGPVFKGCLVYYTCAFFLDSINSFLNNKIQLLANVSLVLNITSSGIWIPLWLILYFNSKTTEATFTDLVYARSYAITRRAMMIIPVALKSLTWAVFFMLSAESDYSSISDVDNLDTGIFHQMIFQSYRDIAPLGWFSFLIHLDNFSVTFMVIALLIIWKPKVVPKLENHADLLRAVAELEATMEDGYAPVDLSKSSV